MSDLPLTPGPVPAPADLPPAAPAGDALPATEGQASVTPAAATAAQAGPEGQAEASPEPSAAASDDSTAEVAAEVAVESAAEAVATVVDPAAPAARAAQAEPAELPQASVAATESSAPADAASAAAAPASARAARDSVDLDAVAAALKQHFPALFGGAPKPLKLRIQTDIQQRAPGQFTKRALGVFFHRYTTSTNYLIALAQGTQRFDLDGQPAGELSEEHRTLAQQEVERRRALRREREAQFKPQARTPAGAERGERGDRNRPPRGPRRGEAPAAGAAAAPTEAAAVHADRPPRPPRGDRPPRDAAAASRGPRPERTDRGDRGERGDRPQRPERGPRPARAERHDARDNRGPQRRDMPAARPPRQPQMQHEAAVDAAPLPTDPAERAAVEARRARATLLRDFERSPLSLANFCALKGLSPAQLEPMLAQARQERGAR